MDLTARRNNDTIAAIATPPGNGGVGIIRISGPKSQYIASSVVDAELSPRLAHYGNFYECKDGNKSILDQGIALFFPGPHSFTGEDVLELHCHGGSIILNCMLQEVIAQGARSAQPGEFSERAFLNGKIDLAQAEAIADLISSSSEQAAKSAVRSLSGVFSETIHELVDSVTQLRCYVEAAIDFPEEEIDFLADGKVAKKLDAIHQQLLKILSQAKQGAILREGMTIVIAGKPNAGKSSLLNTLSGKASAIVTDIEGTTRDILREHIQIDGMPLHIIDTAGIRESNNIVEQEGIRRAQREIEQADRVLWVIDASTEDALLEDKMIAKARKEQRLSIIFNKCDLLSETPKLENHACESLWLSAKTGQGVDELRQHLKTVMGYHANNETAIIARQRHLDKLQDALTFVQSAASQLTQSAAGELVAEDLRLCQQSLGEITGEFTPDDLLGEIFSSFCIGK